MSPGTKTPTTTVETPALLENVARGFARVRRDIVKSHVSLSRFHVTSASRILGLGLREVSMYTLNRPPILISTTKHLDQQKDNVCCSRLVNAGEGKVTAYTLRPTRKRRSVHAKRESAPSRLLNRQRGE